MKPTMPPPVRTLDEVMALVDSFEQGTLPHTEWDHTAHLTVAAWYLATLPECHATERMIRGIRRHNNANGVRSTPTGGYHETLTLFWLAAVRVVLERAGSARDDIVGRIVAVCETYRSRGSLPLEYYERGVLFSEVARTRWVRPTRFPGGDLAGLSRVLGQSIHDGPRDE